jgi:hypothetical protein
LSTSTVTNLTDIGVFTVNTSSVGFGLQGGRAFDKNGNTFWHAAESLYDTAGNYIASGGAIAKLDGSISGEWITIEFPYQVFVDNFSHAPRTNTPERAMVAGSILGYDDTSTGWDTLASWSGLTWTTSEATSGTMKVVNVGATKSYRKFGFVVTGTEHTPNVAQLKIFGTFDDTSVNIKNEGSISLMKSLDVPTALVRSSLGVGGDRSMARLGVQIAKGASMGGTWSTGDFVVSHFQGQAAPNNSLGVAIGVDYVGTGNGGGGNESTSTGYLWCMRPNLTWNTLKIMGNKLELIGLSSVILNGGASVTSDDRLKTEEEFLQNALPTIMKLKPQKYRKASFLPNDPLKATTENMSEQGDTTFIETGLIVQDIWYDAPELRDLIILGENANPSETKPVDPDPSDPTQDPDYTSWGTTSAVLNYQGVFVVALKAIQELNTDLQVEKAKVADLLARVQALENA